MYEILPSRHPTLHLPRLCLTSTEAVVSATVRILFLCTTRCLQFLIYKNTICCVNIQHDCAESRCNQMDVVCEIQERIETTKQVKRISHSATKDFVLNIHSLHNYQHISAALPTELNAPFTFITDANKIRKLAVQQMRKRTAGTSEDTPPAEANNRSMTISAPAFDRTASRGSKRRGTGREKTMAKRKRADPTAATTQISADTPQPIAQGSTTGMQLQFQLNVQQNHTFYPNHHQLEPQFYRPFPSADFHHPYYLPQNPDNNFIHYDHNAAGPSS
jgi:hypothetical protein